MEHPVILLTGQPGVGKTTAIQRVAARVGDGAGGFYTREVRQRGRRVGFEIVTLDGKTAWLAAKTPTIPFPRQVGFKDYRINLDALDSIAVPALLQAAQAGKIVIVDEIGPMEIYSRWFRAAILGLLNDASVTLLGAIVQRPNSFADQVKSHSRVTLKLVTPDNRDRVPLEILSCVQPLIRR